MNQFGIQQGVTIRMPATANLMIDSEDRNASYKSPWDFQIVKGQSIQNGFFSRIATTEVVLDWCIPNINTGFNTLIFDISGATNVLTNEVITIDTGFYTMEEFLDTVVAELNALTTGSTFSVKVANSGQVTLDISGGEFGISQETPLSDALGIVAGITNIPSIIIQNCANILSVRYIDFVSNQLTYNQDLKDNSTANFNRDVLCRWYMAWDTEPQYDGYGFPILMGYKKFILRRLFNPPKYIRWDNAAPLGNLSFQVYDNDGNLVTEPSPDIYRSSWLMTLQLSEN
jgi:hypothetical protein